MGAFFDIAQQAGTVGVGTARGLVSSLGGHPDLVHFIDPATNSVMLQCDAVLNETHSRECAPTVFPVEDGSSIEDHIIVSPLELSLQGVITDSPIGDKSSLITEGIATGLTAVLPPLGVFEAAAGYALYQAVNSPSQGAGLDVKGRTLTRSQAAFNSLLKLQGGDPTAVPPVPPKPFDVTTKLRRYPSMVIRSLSVPRDAQSSTVIVFTLSLAQMLVVRPQSVDVKVLAAPVLAAAKAKLGEQEELGEDHVEDSTVTHFQKGDILGVATLNPTANFIGKL